jgi:hypothetical protein
MYGIAKYHSKIFLVHYVIYIVWWNVNRVACIMYSKIICFFLLHFSSVIVFSDFPYDGSQVSRRYMNLRTQESIIDALLGIILFILLQNLLFSANWGKILIMAVIYFIISLPLVVQPYFYI